MSKILVTPDRLFQPGALPVAMAAISTALALVVGAVFIPKGCQRSIPVTVSASVQAIATSTASQSIRVTIRRPSTSQNTSNTTKNTIKPNDIATLESSQKLTQQAPHKGLLDRVVGVFHPVKQATGLPAPQSGPSAVVANNATAEEEIVIEMEQSMASQGSGEASASAIASSGTQNSYNSIGIIAGTMPGTIAIDYRALHLGPLGIDIEANHRQVGAGVSVGEKFFGVAGGYLGLDGGRGVFVGAGCRF